jgi:peptidoglycan/LPS O-acetylase OafA/YrhL
MVDSNNGPLVYKKHIPGLDVLRGIAILMVLLYHGTDGRVPWDTTTSWLHWPLFVARYGFSGVQLFFILSGFLITGILMDTAAKTDYYRKFYVRRFLRIMPVYLLMLVVLKLTHIAGWKFILAALLYIANMASLVGARTSEYGVLWSLAVEEQFYLIWPFMVRKLSPHSLTRFILGYFVFDLVLRIIFLFYFPTADIAYKLWFNAELLLAGALIAISLRRNLLHGNNITRWIRLLAVLACVAWPMTLFYDLHPSHALWHGLLGVCYRFSFLFTYSALLLVGLRSNTGPHARLSAGARLLTFFGYISYGLYLVHQLVFYELERMLKGTALDDYARRPAMLLLNTALCCAISILLAWLSRRFFEERFLRQKDRIVPYQAPAANNPAETNPASVR